MMEQRQRQLRRYKLKRPVDSEEYQLGVKDAIASVRNEMIVECPHHIDTGRFLRWTLGFTDKLQELAHSQRNFIKKNLSLERGR